jgi:acyl-CoA synthetase (AMP-forming)/AMP-acid ligase II
LFGISLSILLHFILQTNHGDESYRAVLKVVIANCLVTYKELDSRVDSLAGGLLKLGLQHQEMVGLHLGNCTDFVYSYFAIIRAGGVVVPINDRGLGRLTKNN